MAIGSVFKVSWMDIITIEKVLEKVSEKRSLSDIKYQNIRMECVYLYTCVRDIVKFSGTLGNVIIMRSFLLIRFILIIFHFVERKSL